MISIVIPVKDGEEDLRRCLWAIARQRVDEEVEVVVIDSASTDGSATLAAAMGARVHSIAAAEFNHGGTRNVGVSLARGEVVVFTSQDAYAPADDWLARLTAPVRAGTAAGAYGRQLAHDGASAAERYFLDFPLRADLARAGGDRAARADHGHDALLERQRGDRHRRAAALLCTAVVHPDGRVDGQHRCSLGRFVMPLGAGDYAPGRYADVDCASFVGFC